MSKAFMVVGEKKTLNGISSSDLAEKVEKAIDDFVSTVDPKSIVDVKVSADFTSSSGGQAFILVLYKSEMKQENDTNHQDDGKVIKYKK
jgi:hypothetical protein